MTDPNLTPRAHPVTAAQGIAEAKAAEYQVALARLMRAAEHLDEAEAFANRTLAEWRDARDAVARERMKAQR